MQAAEWHCSAQLIDSPTTSLFCIQTGGPHFAETVWIMAKDRTKQSIRNMLPDDSGETNGEESKRPLFVLAAKGYMSLQIGDMQLSQKEMS